MANIFNKVFVNVSKKITSAVSRTRKSPLDYLKHGNDKSFFLSSVAPEDVECLINSLQDGKAAGCMIVNDSFFVWNFP